MTQALQLFVFISAIVGLVAFGFHRDKKEHAVPKDDPRQSEMFFPEHPKPDRDEREHRGAAMSRL
jgi:hypothetical protein